MEPKVDRKGALDVYARASLFDDADLANRFVEKASETPPHRIPLHILHRLPTRGLSTLVSTTKFPEYGSAHSLILISCR